MEEQETTHYTDIDKDPQKTISPVIGIFKGNDLSFKESIERCYKLVDDVLELSKSSIFFAENMKEKFGLTNDEIASINLYTLDSDFYKILNRKLRERNRDELLPFFPYMRHLLRGLNKLPTFNGKIWRGVKLDLSNNYPTGKKFFWWSFSSCTTNIEVLESEQYCGITGVRTLFCISTINGRDIRKFSNFSEEGEILLIPGYFIVKGVMKPAIDLTIIDIEELSPPFDIFIGLPTPNPISNPNPIPNPIPNPTPNPTPNPIPNPAPNPTPNPISNPNYVQEIHWGQEIFTCQSCNRTYSPELKGYEEYIGSYWFELKWSYKEKWSNSYYWFEGLSWNKYPILKKEELNWSKSSYKKSSWWLSSNFKLGDIIECAFCPQKIKFLE